MRYTLRFEGTRNKSRL